MITDIGAYAMFRAQLENKDFLRALIDDLNKCKQMITDDAKAAFKVIKKRALLTTCDKCTNLAIKLNDQASLSQVKTLKDFFEREIERYEQKK